MRGPAAAEKPARWSRCPLLSSQGSVAVRVNSYQHFMGFHLGKFDSEPWAHLVLDLDLGLSEPQFHLGKRAAQVPRRPRTGPGLPGTRAPAEPVPWSALLAPP